MKYGFTIAISGVQCDVMTFLSAIQTAALELFGAPVLVQDWVTYDSVTETQETQITLVADTGAKHPAHMKSVLDRLTNRAWTIASAYGGTAMGDGGLNVWHGRWVWNHKRY